MVRGDVCLFADGIRRTFALFFTRRNLEEEMSKAAGESCSTLHLYLVMVRFCFLGNLFQSISPKHVRLLTHSRRFVSKPSANVS